MENTNSHLTAIERKYLSFPAHFTVKNKLLQGKILDFGCGVGNDVKLLKEKSFDITGYDPFYFPTYPQEKYDTIICFYVLNVLLEQDQEQVIMEIAHLLKPKGKAYFAVRRDLKKEGYRRHYVHKKMTYQCLVKLPFESLHQDEFCEIYCYSHYNQIQRPSPCIFCNPYASLTLLTESTLSYAMLDGYPLTKGHSLIIPKKHEENYFDLSLAEQQNCWQMVNFVQKIITEKYHPDGFNVGMNINQAGGQKMNHCQIHLIPRYQGDNQGKKHGIRQVLGKQ
ncbi:MAG: HIT domain-containing protein [Cyanobacterium sp. T60_A2020_053]|nr:HIT domain-containing protein [Cyanobacterium sp. T60_A2020_053]